MSATEHRDLSHPDFKTFRDWEGKRTGEWSRNYKGWTLSVLNGVTTQLTRDGETHMFKTAADAEAWVDLELPA